MTTRTRLLSLLAVAAAAVTTLTVLPASASASTPAASRDPGLVRTDSGWLRGNVAADHTSYSNIPYAAPPVGERRWRPPARPRSWSGVRDATTPSPFCPQYASPETEDCLYLDVAVPRSARSGKRLPVVVWLYGGSFNTGGSREYDGTRLATSGEVIVVTPNYRLGALGFLSSPDVDRSGGNYGLMDQAAVLRWVSRNAASFGGDPRNVTLAGESAGARAVCAQLASPLSRGLFHRAIIQSGACDNDVLTLAEARSFGARATEQLGCATADDVAACMRAVPPRRLVGALGGVGFKVNGRVKDRPWNPVAGTSVLPQQPAKALRNGTAARVPLLIGSTRDEMRGFVSGEDPLPTAEKYAEIVRETFGADADAVMAAYPVADYDGPALALDAVLSDWGGSIGACPTLRTAQAAAARRPVYAYEFAEDSGQDYNGVPLGAYHGLELPFLFDLDMLWDTYPELTEEQWQLSATMIDYWSAFARTGNPNGDGRPRWSEYGASGKVLGLSTAGIAPTPYAVEHKCDLWAGIPR